MQVNIGEENQKSGINKNGVSELVFYCKEIGLDLIGLMCIPPINIDPENYFKEIDDTLNSSIYGLDTAKLQIKRMVAQWINGKNEGYIFGFEGPPGTGKTTLAKRGIAKCLKDEFGIDLIVMGSHGASGLKEMFVGSNAEKVVRTSDVPVLVIKNEHRSFNVSDFVFASDFKNDNKNIKNYFLEYAKNSVNIS